MVFISGKTLLGLLLLLSWSSAHPQGTASVPPGAVQPPPIVDCRCIPGDACWPVGSAWTALNSTLHGRLIGAKLMGSVCHDPTYDEVACAALKTQWALPQTHYPHPVEIMSPFWQNQTCDPFTDKSSACSLGNYVEYAINVSSAADIQAGLKFVQKHNIRLVIKNTGHDYLGKSTGKGALSLWMHNLKGIEFKQYSSPSYTGAALKMGAGVQAFEAYTAADAHGHHIVGGSCATVGLAGGFLQGGGHSIMSSKYGMAADQVLEWEVITAKGELLTASPRQNKNLYWALSGGGGGTYGVVVSVTVKAFKDDIVGGAFLSFNKTGITDDTFWKGVEAFHTALPAIVDSGATVVYSLDNSSFYVVPLTAPGKTEAQVSALLKPFLSRMKSLSVHVTATVTSSAGFLEHFERYLGPLPYGLPLINIIDVSLAGRLIPRKVVESPKSNAALIDALKVSVYPGKGFLTGGIGMKATHKIAGTSASSNAVLPAWRDTILQVLAFAPWDFQGTLGTNTASQDYLVDVTIPALAKVAPEGGAYLNEANFQQPDWRKSFYGANYPKLKGIKKMYDPQDLFFGNTAVGSEDWAQDGAGRLCRIKPQHP